MCVLLSLSLRCKLEARIEREREREGVSIEAGDPKGAEVQAGAKPTSACMGVWDGKTRLHLRTSARFPFDPLDWTSVTVRTGACMHLI
jgi:hypothetical protein